MPIQKEKSCGGLLAENTDHPKSEAKSEANDVPLILVKPYGPAFEKVARRIEARGNLRLIECEQAADAVTIAKQARNCVILCHFPESQVLVKLITAMKLMHEGLAAREIRVLATSTMSLWSVRDKLMNYGFQDLIQEPITEKALEMRLQRQLQLAKSHAHEQKLEAKHLSETMGETSGGRDPAQGVQAGGKLVQEPPLELKSDCWLLDNHEARRVGARWMIRLEGPGPLAGRWVEIATDSMEHRRWAWEPQHKDLYPFIQDTGRWVFSGERYPEPLEEFWSFVGKRPSLAFIHEDKEIAVRFRTEKDGSLHISRDSVQAREVLKDASKTWEKHLREFGDDAEDTSKEEREIAGGKSGKKFATENEERAKKAMVLPDKPAHEEKAAGEISSAQKTEEPESPELLEGQASLAQQEKLNQETQRFTEAIAEKVAEAEKNEELPAGSQAIVEIVRSEMKQPKPEPKVEVPALDQSGEEDPLTIQADVPPGPSLSPLALCFVMSELVTQADLSLEQIANRYCRYLGASCGGLRVEIWTQLRGEWKCVGSPGGTPGKFLENARAHQPGTLQRELALVATDIANPKGGQPLGVLIIGGRGSELVAESYLGIAARLSVGWLLEHAAQPGSELSKAA